MKKSTWIILILLAGTLAFLVASPLIPTRAAEVAPTSTRWPTKTFTPTSTRWPSATPSLTSSLWPSQTSSLTSTRWPTISTATRWPTITTSRTATRWPTPVTPAIDTRVPTKTNPPIDTRVPTSTLLPTDTRVPTATPPATATRWPTVTRFVSPTKSLVPGAPTFTKTLTPSRTPSRTPTRSSTRTPTNTRWPVKPTDTRWPVIPTDTRWPTAPIGTRWPTAVTRITDTRVPSLTPRLTDTRVPTNAIQPTSTRWPTVTTGPTKTRTPTITRTPSSTPLPPPTSTTSVSWLPYTNALYGFAFNYPADASITGQQDNFVQIYMTIAPNTNLVSKYLEVYASQGDVTCYGHYGGASGGTITIAGHSFNVQSGSDAGAGQIHEWTSYSIVQGVTCISFNFILHSGNIGNYPAGTPAFDRTAEVAIFPQILATFNWLAPTATPVTGLPLGPYAVVEVAANDVLNIRSGAGTAYGFLGSYPYNATGIQRTGLVQTSGGATWYQVQPAAGGPGWVNSYYLTEAVAPNTFCGDGRVQNLIGQLRQAVNSSSGATLAALVSPPHGLDVYYWRTGNVIHYTAADAAAVFSSYADQNWGSGPSGTDTHGTFAAIVQPALQEVLNAAYQSFCDNPKAASVYGIPWPYMYTNFNYYSLYKPGTPGVDVDYAQWMTGVDYVNGQPYLATLIRIIWEP